MQFCSSILVVLCLFQAASINASEPNGKQCSKQAQSPIDVGSRTNITKVVVGNIVFSEGFKETPRTQTVQADGHSVVIKSTFKSEPSISGGPLDGKYNLNSIHFHWGDDDTKGSEHTRSGVASPMEMHAVFTRDGLSFDEAKAHPLGLAVIGYFIEIKVAYNQTTMNPFSILAKGIKKLKAPLVDQALSPKFPISKLVVPFDYRYLTYSGSLTTGDCNEVVTWILAPKVLKISQNQIAAFRGLHGKKLVESANNFRRTQPLNSRLVRYDN